MRRLISRQLALEKEKAGLEATLEKEIADLEAEILGELKLEHKLDYKKLDDQNNHLTSA